MHIEPLNGDSFERVPEWELFSDMEGILRLWGLLGPNIRPINYSFVVMKICPTSLVSTCKIQKNFNSEMRLVGLINIY